MEEKQFVLLLFQTGDFKGLLALTPNPAPTPGIWFYEQGSAKTPLPFATQVNGTYQIVAGPCLLIYGGNGGLEATVWDFDASAVKDGDTGSISTPTLNCTWKYDALQGRSGELYRVAPELANKLAAANQMLP